MKYELGFDTLSNDVQMTKKDYSHVFVIELLEKYVKMHRL